MRSRRAGGTYTMNWASGNCPKERQIAGTPFVEATAEEGKPTLQQVP